MQKNQFNFSLQLDIFFKKELDIFFKKVLAFFESMHYNLYL